MDEYKNLILDICKSHKIDPNYVCAIIEQESSWNRYAVRYEPSWDYLVESPKPNSTELQTQKTSWGLGQIMGSVAREQGLTGYLTQLVQPEINILHMCLLLGRLSHYSMESTDLFAMYNGGPGALRKIETGEYRNQFYVNKVSENLKKYHL